MTDTKQLPMQLFSFDDLDRMAVAVAKSGLFGCKTAEQAIGLLLLAQAEGVHPMQAVQDFDIIQGRPSRKATSILARFQAAGGTVKWLELTDQCARATFSHPQGGAIEMSWTIEMAATAGLTQKDGSMYRKYPRAMLRSRCMTEGVRTVYPAAVGGLLSTDEAADLDPIDITTTATATVIAGPRRKSETQDDGADAKPAQHTHSTEGDGPAHPNAIKSMLKMADAKKISNDELKVKFGRPPSEFSVNQVNDALAWLRNGTAATSGAHVNADHREAAHGDLV